MSFHSNTSGSHVTVVQHFTSICFETYLKLPHITVLIFHSQFIWLYLYEASTPMVQEQKGD